MYPGSDIVDMLRQSLVGVKRGRSDLNASPFFDEDASLCTIPCVGRSFPKQSHARQTPLVLSHDEAKMGGAETSIVREYHPQRSAPRSGSVSDIGTNPPNRE